MITDKLQGALKDAARAAGFHVETVEIEHPADIARGDYATNLALKLSKLYKAPPNDIAQAITKALRESLPVEVDHVEVAGPGFINLFLSRNFFEQKLQEMLSKASNWGRNELYEGKQILVEYTSPNLFKPLHIGNLVGNILGESLTRIFEFAGAEVKRLNYPSDIGLTVAKSVWGLQKTGGDPTDIKALGDAYRKGNDAYENDPRAKSEIDEVNQALYEGSNEELNRLRGLGVETSRAHLAHVCQILGTVFDTEFFESQSGEIGKHIVLHNLNRNVFEESDGAIIYRGEREGLHTRVFLNSAKLPTYEAKELGLFKLKYDAYPDFDISITVTGSEQKEFFRVVFSVIQALWSDRLQGKELRHIANGFLRLTTGKMSTRLGNVITGEALLSDLQKEAEEKMQEREVVKKESVAQMVAVAAIKFAVLKQGSGRDIVFDSEESLSLEGDSGPYVQYARTRASSVIKKARAEGVLPDATLSIGSTSDVERILYRFEEVVLRAAKECEPHYIATYLAELSARFNRWYAKEKILDGTSASLRKLAVCFAVEVTLKNGLYLLGIQVPEQM